MIIACTPFVSLYFPLLGLLIVGWGLVAIAAYPELEKIRWWALLLAPIIAAFLSSGLIPAVFMGLPFLILYLNVIKRGVFSLAAFGIFFVFLFFVGQLSAASASLFFKPIFVAFQLSFLMMGLIFLHTYIRRTGIDPITRSGSLKFQSAALLVLGFIVLMVKYSTFYGGDIGLYFHVFTAKIKIYLLMAGLLLLAAAIFAREELRYRKANAS